MPRHKTSGCFAPAAVQAVNAPCPALGRVKEEICSSRLRERKSVLFEGLMDRAVVALRDTRPVSILHPLNGTSIVSECTWAL